jgi:predicted dehydrogenase
VLRYTPFYRKVKKIIESGALGKIVSVCAREGVGAWHQAHSYVRGQWAVTETCTPMIIAKSCHDLDILYWLIGRPCTSVSSYGGLNHFTKQNKPEGSPLRCTDGCPLGLDCTYHAMHYAGRNRELLHLAMDGGATASADEIEAWLKHSPWGRCVYSCDNTAVDHQVVAMEFEGDITATFTMTAFDEGRSIEIFGTKARLFGGTAYKEICGDDIVVVDHAEEKQTRHRITFDDQGYAGHGGGDAGLMRALHEEMRRPDPEQMLSSIHTSVMSHAMGFAAEQARIMGAVINLEDFQKRGFLRE